MGIIENAFHTFGLLPIETPALENLSTLQGKYGDEGDQLLFKVLNSGDFMKGAADRVYSSEEIIPKISEKGLRYDLTVPLARFVVQNRNEIQFPFRRYQMQPVWRADKPQKGRYREFWQCDADIIGTDSLLSESDLLGLYQMVFEALQLKVQIQINHRKILEGFAVKAGVQDRFRTLTVIIDKMDKIGIEGVNQLLLNNGFTETETKIILPNLGKTELSGVTIQELKASLTGIETGLEGCADLEQLLQYYQDSGYTGKLFFNGALARGLDYYTGCIFEVISDECAMGSISGGGRYDNLTGIFGMPGISGVGISFGLDRIYDVLEQLNRFPNSRQKSTRVLCCYMDEQGRKMAVQTVSDLRQMNIPAEVYPDIKKIGKQLEYADKRNIPFVMIWGEKEILEQKLTLKNLESGEQFYIDMQEAFKLVK